LKSTHHIRKSCSIKLGYYFTLVEVFKLDSGRNSIDELLGVNDASIAVGISLPEMR
jgi:hypothetical protein